MLEEDRLCQFRMAPKELKEAVLERNYAMARQLVMESSSFSQMVKSNMVKELLVQERAQKLFDLKFEEAESWMKEKTGEYTAEGSTHIHPLKDGVSRAVRQLAAADRPLDALGLVQRYGFEMYCTEIAQLAGQILRFGFAVPSEGV